MKTLFLSLLIFIISCSQKTTLKKGETIMDHEIINKQGSMKDTITLGGGCFWCVEAVITKLKGVESVVSGYSGGKIKNPTYREVCSGLTGHAEVVQIVYDPTVIPLERLLEIFFKSHDPTTLNRQGADIGIQYRSVIFYHSNEQKDVSKRLIDELNKSGIWSEPIVTELVPYDAFYIAEDYHQDYFENNPFQPYCQVVINPKIKKLEKFFSDYLK